jgi:hypothetical protein
VCINAPSVSQLLLDGDSVILMKANMINLTLLRQVSRQYCASSGQMASKEKCSTFFSPTFWVDIEAKFGKS